MQQEQTPIECSKQIMVCTEILSKTKKPKRIHCVKKTSDGCSLFFVSCGISSETGYTPVGEADFRSQYPELFDMMADMAVGSMWGLEEKKIEGWLWTLTDKGNSVIQMRPSNHGWV